MLQETVKAINNKIKQFPFLDFSIFSYEKDELTIAASEDFTYYHQFEIRFKNVFTIIANTTWSVDTKRNSLEIINESEDAYDLNGKYRVEAGNSVFRFLSEGGGQYYIIAEDVQFVDKVVKYY